MKTDETKNKMERKREKKEKKRINEGNPQRRDLFYRALSVDFRIR